MDYVASNNIKHCYFSTEIIAITYYVFVVCPVGRVFCKSRGPIFTMLGGLACRRNGVRLVVMSATFGALAEQAMGQWHGSKLGKEEGPGKNPAEHRHHWENR